MRRSVLFAVSLGGGLGAWAGTGLSLGALAGGGAGCLLGLLATNAFLRGGRGAAGEAPLRGAAPGKGPEPPAVPSDFGVILFVLSFLAGTSAAGGYCGGPLLGGGVAGVCVGLVLGLVFWGAAIIALQAVLGPSERYRMSERIVAALVAVAGPLAGFVFGAWFVGSPGHFARRLIGGVTGFSLAGGGVVLLLRVWRRARKS
jgi:hypothetical protein